MFEEGLAFSVGMQTMHKNGGAPLHPNSILGSSSAILWAGKLLSVNGAGRWQAEGGTPRRTAMAPSQAPTGISITQNLNEGLKRQN